VLTKSEEIWPNFFIVGAQKAGTTSLYFYLKKIPGVYMSPVKEVFYFTTLLNTDDADAQQEILTARPATNVAAHSGPQLC
jgi:hypothetical protein